MLNRSTLALGAAVLGCVLVAGCSSDPKKKGGKKPVVLADAGAGAQSPEPRDDGGLPPGDDQPEPQAKQDGGVVDEAQLSEALFEAEKVLEVEVELAAADWDALRAEGRSLTHLHGLRGQGLRLHDHEGKRDGRRPGARRGRRAQEGLPRLALHAQALAAPRLQPNTWTISPCTGSSR